MIEKILLTFALLLIMLFFYGTIVLGYSIYHQPTCLQNGYSHTEVTYNFEVYCTGKNEVVIPIGDIE